MIWGKTLDPGKLYTEVVHSDIHLSMAALESRTERGADYNGYTQVMLKTDTEEFLLCTLVHGVIFQQHLDVQLKKGEEISVFTQGKNKVHLTGYSVCINDTVGTSEADLEHTESRQDEDEPISNQNEEYDSVPGWSEGAETPVIKKEYPDPEEIFWPPLRPPVPFGILPRLTTDFLRWDQRLFSHDQRPVRDPSDIPMTSTSSPDAHPDVKPTVSEERNHMPVTAFGHPRLQQESDEGAQYTSEGEDVQPEQPLPRATPSLPISQPTSPRIIQRTQPIIRTPHRRKGEATKYVHPQQHHTGRSPQMLSSPIQTQVIQRARPLNCNSLNELAKLPVPSPITGYQCQFCSKLFRNISNFKSHQLVHTNLKPYKCRFCGVGFKQTGNLKAHERIHTGDRPYKCSYCSKQFARSTTRNTHEKLHTGPVKYPCKLCDKVFMNVNALKNHEIVKHKVQMGPPSLEMQL